MVKSKDQFLLAFQEEEEEVEAQRLPERKNSRNKYCKTASKPSRILFAENSETAPKRPSDLLPSPSQIDPECLAALPDDVRHEIEQHYKRKESHVTRGERVDSHVTRVHIQTQPPGDRVSERNTTTFEAGDVQEKGKTQVVAAPKQVHFYRLFCNFNGV